MENYASNLQDKIQKLIDQYTAVKKKYDEMVEENNILTEQNLQMIEQIDNQTKQSQDADGRMTAIEQELARSNAELDALKRDNHELKQNLQGFESAAKEALSKLDFIFPDIEEA